MNDIDYYTYAASLKKSRFRDFFPIAYRNLKSKNISNAIESEIKRILREVLSNIGTLQAFGLRHNCATLFEDLYGNTVRIYYRLVKLKMEAAVSSNNSMRVASANELEKQMYEYIKTAGIDVVGIAATKGVSSTFKNASKIKQKQIGNASNIIINSSKYTAKAGMTEKGFNPYDYQLESESGQVINFIADILTDFVPIVGNVKSALSAITNACLAFETYHLNKQAKIVADHVNQKFNSSDLKVNIGYDLRNIHEREYKSFITICGMGGFVKDEYEVFKKYYDKYATKYPKSF